MGSFGLLFYLPTPGSRYLFIMVFILTHRQVERVVPCILGAFLALRLRLQRAGRVFLPNHVAASTNWGSFERGLGPDIDEDIGMDRYRYMAVSANWVCLKRSLGLL